MRNDGPCKDCQERFTACSDKCPKDERGECGYKTWLEKVHKEETAKKEWRRQKREDSIRDARYGFTTKKRRY